MKRFLLLVSTASLIVACTHASGESKVDDAKYADVPDDAIEKDAILGTFDEPVDEREPRGQQETRKDDGPREVGEAAGPPVEVDSREEKEDAILSTLEPQEETGGEPSRELEGDERRNDAEELDAKEVREDPILSALEEKGDDKEENGKKDKKKRKEQDEGKGGGV